MPTNVGAGSSLFAPHPTIASLWVALTDSTNSNLITFARCNGAPDTTANVFAHGCLMIRTDSGTGNKAVYENVGSSAAPSWNLIGDITAGEITLAAGSILVGNASGVAAAQRQYGAVTTRASNTSGSLFGSSTFGGSLTGISFAPGPQGGAGTVTISNAGVTIATLTVPAGGATQGSVIGSNIAASAFTSAANLAVVTSGATVDGALTATFITGAAS